MKEVLLSTRPKWCGKIGSGEKKIEVRKTRPKEQEPFKGYIYCTMNDKNEQVLLVDKNGRLSFGDYRNASNGDCYIADGKVIGEFICDKVYEFESEFTSDKTYERIRQVCRNESNDYLDWGYHTVATNEDELRDNNELCKLSCLTWDELRAYVGKGIKTFYAWHISNLVIYDKPKKLSDFYKLCPTKEECDCGNCERFEQYVCTNYLTRPPQSWQYILDKWEKER